MSNYIYLVFHERDSSTSVSLLRRIIETTTGKGCNRSHTVYSAISPIFVSLPSSSLKSGPDPTRGPGVYKSNHQSFKVVEGLYFLRIKYV